jgi:hypothetical protein
MSRTSLRMEHPLQRRRREITIVASDFCHIGATGMIKG